MLNIRIKNVLVPMMMAAFIFVSSSFAQDTGVQNNDMNKQNAERWTQSLNNRLTLTGDQQTRIYSILMDYQTRRSQLGAASDPQVLQTEVNRQIEGVLDDNQRTNWDAYSATWWTEINRGTGTENEMYKKSPNKSTDTTNIDMYEDRDTSSSGDKDKR